MMSICFWEKTLNLYVGIEHVLYKEEMRKPGLLTPAPNDWSGLSNPAPMPASLQFV
jgi:hypothetical protein